MTSYTAVVDCNLSLSGDYSRLAPWLSFAVPLGPIVIANVTFLPGFLVKISWYRLVFVKITSQTH